MGTTNRARGKVLGKAAGSSVKVAGRLFRGYLHLSALISHISSDNLVI